MLVADPTCKALLRYARALAEANASDIVTIPVITEGGSQASAHVLIGPASELFSTPVEHASDEPIDAEAVAHLERETLRLQPSRPVWADEMTDIPDLSQYDIQY